LPPDPDPNGVHPLHNGDNAAAFLPPDAHWLRYALTLAQRVTARQTAPNPRVSCVVLNAQGQLVGEGWHAKAGTPHAEVHALTMAQAQAQGGTAYVTLEPCNHTGRTPPCVNALVAAGIMRVVVGTQDPNPRVQGQGIAALQQAGIHVTMAPPYWAAQAQAINTVFNHHIVAGLPYTTVKLATTLDGYMTDAMGQSQWITGPEARQHVHAHRQQADAILSTARTVLADNAQLTVRLTQPTGTTHASAALVPVCTPPIRIILDAHARLKGHPKLAIWQTEQAPTWVVTQARHQASYQAQYPHARIVVGPPNGHGGFSLLALWRQCYQQGITSLWAEAGPRLTAQLLHPSHSQLVQQIMWYRSGHLLGGGQGASHWPTPLPLTAALPAKPTHTQQLGNTDVLTTWTCPPPVL
jgi:diaminohydroxyphosphoribosylaminopyrimidine deaminase / 5-amino-6-(5-phosphoribosylamino)uracil reductase